MPLNSLDTTIPPPYGVGLVGTSSTDQPRVDRKVLGFVLSAAFVRVLVRTWTSDLILKREYPGVLRRHGFEDDAVAEALELGQGPLTLAIGVAPHEVVATQILVVAVVGEQAPRDHQDRVRDSKGRLLLPDTAGQPPVLGGQVAVTTACRRPGAPG